MPETIVLLTRDGIIEEVACRESVDLVVINIDKHHADEKVIDYTMQAVGTQFDEAIESMEKKCLKTDAEYPFPEI